MSDAKIEIKAGGAEFSATGNQDWVAKQLDKFLANATKLATIPAADENGGGSGSGGSGGGNGDGGKKRDPGIAGKPLATHLKEQDATTNQTKKFLATAGWLHARGAKRLSTGDIAKALKASNQTKINNPSECLNLNVKKGLCEKDGTQFFVIE